MLWYSEHFFIYKIFWLVEFFHELFSDSSRNGYRYDICSSWWCSDNSVSIWIYSETGLSTDFSSSEKSIVFVTCWILEYPYNTKLFSFFYVKFSLGIGEFFDSFGPLGLFLELGFFGSDSTFIRSRCHDDIYRLKIYILIISCSYLC